MKLYLSLTAASACAISAANAGGIDRAGQPADILFKEGNYAEISVTHTNPDISGSDLAQSPPGFPFPYDSGASYNDVANDFTSFGFGVKYEFTDKFSVALTGSEDFGADIFYDNDPLVSLLGETSVKADTYALTLFGRYKFTENWAMHGGVRADWADGDISLGGLAYGPVNGYSVDLDETIGYGYVIGGSYEIPEYAFRLAVTYNSRITHDFKTKETLNGASLGSSSKTKVDTPQSVNVDFQTGVAKDTLLFGSARWVEWSEFKIEPELFENITGVGIVDLEDTTTWTLGLGRRFTERFAGSLAFQYEGPNDKLVSPLAPVNGFSAVILGGSYRVDNIELSGGVRYAWLGDANPETGTPDVARADFRDNTAVSVGVKVGYYF